MSCVPELYALSKSKIKAELDLPNYAKKKKKKPDFKQQQELIHRIC